MPDVTSAPTAGPVPETSRIRSLDVLRGFALLGILLMNIQAFSMIGAAYLNPTAYGDLTGVHLWVWVLTHILADQKFISIFSMLFGAGLLLMTQRAEQKGARAGHLHYRRMGWLILFGLLHAHLLWYGDILYTYGVCGMLVYLMRRKTPRVLLISAVLVGAIGSLIYLGIGATMPRWPAQVVEELDSRDWKPSNEIVQDELDAYRGGWLGQMRKRVPNALFLQTALLLMVLGWKVSSLMLLGMALFKTGALSAAWSRRAYLGLIAAGLLAGIPVVTLGVWRNFAAGWDVRYSFFFGSQFNYWGSYLVALGWIGFVMLWCQDGRLDWLLKRLAAVGRTAFSNYILQTVLCTTLFYGHGLGYFGHVERLGQLAVVLAVWVLQLAITPWWLQRFTFGPLEWLWRSLTYWKPQPFRRPAPAG